MEMEWNEHEEEQSDVDVLQDNAKSVLDGRHPRPTKKGFVYSGVELYSSDSTF